MKKTISRVMVIMLVIMNVFVTGVFAEEHEVIEKDFDLDGFDRILVEDAFEVQINQGHDFEVRAEFSESVEEKLDIRVDGDTLIIGIKDNQSVMNETYKAEVVLPVLEELTVKYASQVSGLMVVESLTIDASNASEVSFEGAANELRIESLNASSVEMEGFEARNAEVISKYASDVQVSVLDQVEVVAMSASTVEIYGSPEEVAVDNDISSSVEFDSDMDEDDDDFEEDEDFDEDDYDFEEDFDEDDYDFEDDEDFDEDGYDFEEDEDFDEDDYDFEDDEDFDEDDYDFEEDEDFDEDDYDFEDDEDFDEDDYDFEDDEDFDEDDYDFDEDFDFDHDLNSYFDDSMLEEAYGEYAEEVEEAMEKLEEAMQELESLMIQLNDVFYILMD